MEAFGLRFHHLGLAVPDPDRAFLFLGGMGYTAGAAAFDPLQNVNLAMRHHATMPDVEVIWPGAGHSPIDKMIRAGNMFYHSCYIVDDAEASIAALTEAGLRVLSLGRPKPARLFGGVPVSFHRLDGVGLIEFIHGEPLPPLPNDPA